MFWFQHSVSSPKAASHRGVAIKYIDLMSAQDNFILELKTTAVDWVYSQEKYKTIIDQELAKRGGKYINAQNYILQMADQKFRKGCPQGQFGELLLFNFIQHFFKSPPLLRKMSITTNAALERHGADAIHYLRKDESHCFLLGESKCYESKYKFNTALEKSVESIFTSFDKIFSELNLYHLDDFIHPELQEIASELKRGIIKNARFELVCMIVYEETSDIADANEQLIKNKIEQCILERWKTAPSTLYSTRNQFAVERINYIVFPVWGLNKLLQDF